jgi:membrane fusion protein, heavy metal efflux system
MRHLPALAASALAAACGFGPPPTAHHDEHGAADRAAWIAPTPAERFVLVTLVADVEPMPRARSALAPRVQARLVAWRVSPGDRVEVGDALATILSPRLDALDATARAQRRVREARAAELSLGVGTTADLATADADLAAADAAIRDARGATGRDGGETVWTSPIAGVVSAITCQQGAEVDPATACVVIDTPGDVRVRAWVPERHLGRLVDVSATFSAADGRTFGPLALSAIDPAIDPASRTLGVRFEVPLADPPLLAGASGRVALSVRAPDGAVVVPTGALTSVDGREVVFGRDAHHVHTFAAERIGPGPEPGTVVVRAALPEGATVAWRGVFGLKSELLLDEEGGHEH